MGWVNFCSLFIYLSLFKKKKKNEKGNLYTQFLHHNSNVVTMNLCKNDKQLHTIQRVKVMTKIVKLKKYFF